MSERTNKKVNEFSEQAANLIRSDKDIAAPNNVIPFNEYSANAAIAKISDSLGAARQNLTNIFPHDPAQSAQGNAMSDPTREEIKEAIGAAEARGETKIARLEGKLDLVLSKLDDVRQDNRTARANQWVIGFGLALLIVAMFSAFPAFFGIGSQIRDLVHAEVHDQLPAPAPRTSTQK